VRRLSTKFGFALSSAIWLAGCSHGQLLVNTGSAASSSSGTGITTSSSGVNAQASGSTAAVVFSIGLAAIIASRDGDYGTRYGANPFMAIADSPRAPELAPERRINEQDCTKPIEDFSANLKCR